MFGKFAWAAALTGLMLRAALAGVSAPTDNPAAPVTQAAPAVTQHDIIPIVERRCTVCHGARQREAELDLRTRAAMLRGGKSGPAIMPGKPDDSLVIQKLRAGEMPPLKRIVEVSIKPIEPAEVELLARWIALGAPEVEIEPDVASSDPDPLVSDQDRTFWAFHPLPTSEQIRIPSANSDRVRNPIDAFLLERLEAKGLTLAPEADRQTLIRRASFDLTGLPPEPAELQAFLVDSDPRAYETLIDRLLASPRYGERWARHWLDLAGYADSEGKREQDLLRPAAYRYRDYVIRSFNADKPYDRFLLEQIAGDELADYEHASEITEEIYDNLVATGFLRMAPDPTWFSLTNFLPDRMEVIADEIDVLGSGVMGLTMKCARCHNHKYDPIPQRDYYRLLDVFKGAFDEHDWMKSNWHETLSMGVRSDRDLPVVTTAERRAWAAHQDVVQKEIESLRAALDEAAAARAQQHQEERLAALPAVLHADLRAMLATTPDQRSAVQTYLAEKFESTLRIDRDALLKIDADFKRQSEEAAGRIAGLEASRLPEPKIRALWDRGEPSPTYVYRRGDPLSPGRLVGPGVPSVLTDGKSPFVVAHPWPGAKQTGRRLAFARWLTRPDHPLTARVMVNRLWKHHFGSGIVATLGNFGRAGANPSHPELLDWLAREFVRHGWSVKAMHRLMMTSAAYRQSSAVTPAHEELDPGNRLYSRMPLRRLDAEQLYDTLLRVSNQLDERRFGPADPVELRPDGLVTPVASATGWRRSIYLRQQRKQIATLLESFDLPQMNPNCIERRDSTVVTQALHMLNDGMVRGLAAHFAERVERDAGSDPARQVERVYLIALSRLPSDDESELGRSALARLTDAWAKQPARDPAAGQAKPDEAGHRALATFCHTVMNCAEFLYAD